MDGFIHYEHKSFQRDDLCYFFALKKVTQKKGRSKNSLGHFSLLPGFWFALALIRFLSPIS